MFTDRAGLSPLNLSLSLTVSTRHVPVAFGRPGKEKPLYLGRRQCVKWFVVFAAILGAAAHAVSFYDDCSVFDSTL